MTMTRRLLPPALLILLALAFPAFAAEQPADDRAGESAEVLAIAAWQAMPGFIDMYWDAEGGRLMLALDAFDEPFIYQSSLARGVGSNDIGLDRGQLGATRLVEFRRVGPRVLLVQHNLAYRALGGDAPARAATAESFATAVLWGFEVLGERDGAVFVDATAFLLHDAHGIARRLADMEEGTYAVDADRSAVYLPRTKAFPDNSEAEAIVTFTGKPEGELLPTVAPDPTSFTVHLHHSFVRLPPPGYEPLPYDSRGGVIGLSYDNDGFLDYASGIGDPLRVNYGRRHRLAKNNPAAPMSEPVEPIVYYVDRGAPEPVRSALIEGAEWWNQAFEAAGYRDAFRVELLPEDADPLDVRYNVIQWVHRSTRGWSYGSSILDPRTGEIIKGHVTLGSLRVRQDYLIAQGMTSPFTEGDEDTDAMSALALDRIRQLSAHEVGHTLGLAHNFVGSARGRASVMDYPHPRIALDTDGEVSLDGAYASGIGDWDKISIRYGYAELPADETEMAVLSDFLEKARAGGYAFISDPDSRASRQAHPRSHLWDNGADAVAELERLIDLREHALSRFGHRSIANGRPFSDLEEILVPVYLYHRYQLEPVGKWIGGIDYRYAVREGGDDYAYRPVSAVRQRRALLALMRTLRPEFLALDESLRRAIPPKAYGYQRTRESPGGYTGRQLDPVSLAGASVQHTLGILLEPERLARLALQHADDSAHIGVGLLFAQLQENLLPTVTEDGYLALLQQRTAATLLAAWRELVQAPDVAPEVRAESLAALESAARFMRRQHQAPPGYAAFYAYQLSLIEEFRRSPALLPPVQTREMPPGSPIGG